MDRLLNAAGGVTNVVLPGVQAGAHGLAAGVLYGVEAVTAGSIDSVNAAAAREGHKFTHAAQNLKAGWAEVCGSNEAWYYGSSDPPPTAKKIWMVNIPDEKTIAELFVPGTHDTMTFARRASYVNTQTWTLEQQLDQGLRAFDIRVKHVGDELKCYHGSFYLGQEFKDVVHTFEQFLADNPSEGLLVSLSASGCPPTGEHSRSYGDQLQATFGNPEMWMFCSNPPTMGELRGKIYVLSRGAKYLSSPTPQDVQNNYKCANHDEFMAGVMAHATKPREPNTMYCNWLNAVGLDDDEILQNVTHAFRSDWAKTPAACAYLNNKTTYERVEEFLPTVIYMDFPGVQLVEQIIARNF